MRRLRTKLSFADQLAKQRLNTWSAIGSRDRWRLHRRAVQVVGFVFARSVAAHRLPHLLPFVVNLQRSIEIALRLPAAVGRTVVVPAAIRTAGQPAGRTSVSYLSRRSDVNRFAAVLEHRLTERIMTRVATKFSAPARSGETAAAALTRRGSGSNTTRQMRVTRHSRAVGGERVYKAPEYSGDQRRFSSGIAHTDDRSGGGRKDVAPRVAASSNHRPQSNKKFDRTPHDKPGSDPAECNVGVRHRPRQRPALPACSRVTARQQDLRSAIRGSNSAPRPWHRQRGNAGPWDPGCPTDCRTV